MGGWVGSVLPRRGGSESLPDVSGMEVGGVEPLVDATSELEGSVVWSVERLQLCGWAASEDGCADAQAETAGGRDGTGKGKGKGKGLATGLAFIAAHFVVISGAVRGIDA